MNESTSLDPNEQTSTDITPPQPSQEMVTGSGSQQGQYATPLSAPAGETSRGMFDRRIGRLGYFLSNFYLIGASLGLFLLVFLLMPLLNRADPARENPLTAILSIVSFLLAIAFIAVFLLVIISLHVRRLHDLNKSWVWILLLLVPVVDFFFGLYLLLAPGDKDVNKYGEPVTSLNFLTVLGFKQP